MEIHQNVQLKRPTSAETDVPGVPGQFAHVSRPESHILIFVFSHELSRRFRIFWLTELNCERFETGSRYSRRIWLFWEKICSAKFWTCLKWQRHQRTLRTPAKVSRHVGNSVANAVRANSRDPVGYYLNFKSLNCPCLFFMVIIYIYRILPRDSG